MKALIKTLVCLFSATALLLFVFWTRQNDPYILDQVDINVAKSDRVTFEVGGLYGVHAVGIRKTSAVQFNSVAFKTLNSIKTLAISSSPRVEILNGGPGAFSDKVNGFIYLFSISGYGSATISFRLPAGMHSSNDDQISLLILKSPEQTIIN